jgi:hypothetical protein
MSRWDWDRVASLLLSIRETVDGVHTVIAGTEYLPQSRRLVELAARQAGWDLKTINGLLRREARRKPS